MSKHPILWWRETRYGNDFMGIPPVTPGTIWFRILCKSDWGEKLDSPNGSKFRIRCLREERGLQNVSPGSPNNPKQD